MTTLLWLGGIVFYLLIGGIIAGVSNRLFPEYIDEENYMGIITLWLLLIPVLIFGLFISLLIIPACLIYEKIKNL